MLSRKKYLNLNNNITKIKVQFFNWTFLFIFVKIKNMEYTIEQFEIDFESAPNPEAKSEVLYKALDNLDVEDPNVKEVLGQYKNELKDIREQMVSDENTFCENAIRDGKFEVYECIRSLDPFEKGGSYYVMIDDVAKVYEASITAENPIIKEYISTIKPLAYIIVDNGIGTPKRRSVFPKNEYNFEEYFVKR